MSKELKRGKLSKGELDFIHNNASGLPVEEIARRLNRSPETIQTYITKLRLPEHLAGQLPEPPKTIKGSWAYRMLTEEFTLDELKYFGEKYSSLLSQFGGEMVPSEETQVWQIIKFEILMHRNLRDRLKTIQETARLEALSAEFLSEKGGNVAELDEEDRREYKELMLAAASLRDIGQKYSGEFERLQSEHSKLMTALKATRNQRLEKAEAEKENLIGLIKLFQDEEKVAVEGRLLGLAREAAKKEYGRLGEYHTYVDGSVDRPILSADTVGRSGDEMLPSPTE